MTELLRFTLWLIYENWLFFALLSYINVYISNVTYDLSVDLVIFDLRLPLKVKSRLQTFKELCLINGASYDQSLYEIHIASHI